MADSGHRESVPDGWQSREIEGIGKAIGLRGVLKNAIGKSRRKNGCEVVVKGSKVTRQRGVKRQGGFLVVTDAESIVGRSAEPSVHLAVVVFASSPGVGMVGIRMRTAHECAEAIGRVCFATVVDVAEASLGSVGARKPAQEMIETSVFHHHNDDVLYARCFRRRQGLLLTSHPLRSSNTHDSGGGDCSCCPAHKLPAIDTHKSL